MDERTGKIVPQEGGCWYCWEENSELIFSCEFDTYIHRSCIINRAKKVAKGYLNGYDPENEIFLREFGLDI
jgi:hypothetical protein